jgi:transcriptional repressor NrdR
MKCPFCRQDTTQVYNTRPTKFGSQLWRRRRCGNCGQAFTTYEAADLGFITVTKPGAKPRPYSRAKLYGSLHRAFGETTAKPATLEAVTDTIEAKLLNLQQLQLSAAQIAETVLVTLKPLNTAAFVRYLASQAHLASTAHLRRQLKAYDH